MATPVLNLGTSRTDRFIHVEEPRYIMNIRLGWPQSRSGRSGEEKSFLLLWVFEPRTVQAVQSVLRLEVEQDGP